MNTETIETADEVVDRAEIKDGAVLVEYSRTAVALADLQARYKGAAFDLTTTAGDKAARAARLELKTLRTSLEAKRQEFKAPALEFGRRIDAEAKRLTTEILALESPIDQQIKADEERREAERAAKAEAERQRVAAIGMPLSVAGEFTGYTMTIEHGIDDDSALELYVCSLAKFKVDAKEGGTVHIDWSMSSNKTVTPELVGLLCGLEGTEIVATLTPPAIATGPAIDGSTEAFERDHPKDERQADLLDAGSEFARQHGSGEGAE